MFLRTLFVAVIVLCVGALTSAATVGAEPDPVGVWPLRPAPEVVADFDPPDNPYGSGHRGVDLAGAVGQPVRTALAGRVTYAGRLAGRGVVVVSHGDTRTTYEPVAASVEMGTTVSAGQRVGALELAGTHCLPRACLHWGWLRGDLYLDPLDLVGGGPVRLLPLAGLPVGPGTRHAASAGPMAWVAPLPYAGWLPLLRLLRPGVAERRPRYAGTFPDATLRSRTLSTWPRPSPRTPTLWSLTTTG